MLSPSLNTKACRIESLGPIRVHLAMMALGALASIRWPCLGFLVMAEWGGIAWLKAVKLAEFRDQCRAEGVEPRSQEYRFKARDDVPRFTLGAAQKPPEVSVDHRSEAHTCTFHASLGEAGDDEGVDCEAHHQITLNLDWSLWPGRMLAMLVESLSTEGMTL